MSVVLLILDGWGSDTANKFNAINNAITPNWDSLLKFAPHTFIHASGAHVGLPSYQVGNSEVGHETIGGGRVIHQALKCINQSIFDGSFDRNIILNSAFNSSKSGTMHIMGLLSSGGVHSHEDHFIKVIELAVKKNVKHVYVHAFLDGRDTLQRSAFASIKVIDTLLKRFKLGFICTIMGRYYPMDRSDNWNCIEKAYKAIVHGEGDFLSNSAEEALFMSYMRNETDEFVKPTVINNYSECLINNGDTVVFMNFRADRAQQFARALTSDTFSNFLRKALLDINLFTLTNYGKDLSVPIIFKFNVLKNTLGEVFEKNNCNQLRLAESEKYPHVTYFFNGGNEKPFFGEERIVIPSHKVTSHDLKPEMRAYEITEDLITSIFSRKYNFIVCNYANADMVAHAGNYLATIKAIETLDICLGKVMSAVKMNDCHLFITSDHGNAEKMYDFASNQIHTAHTSSVVPFLYFGASDTTLLSNNKCLSDVAPTILSLMHIKQPSEMTGSSIFMFKR